ncbi:unnamed protein product [Bathycoccus prasinos]
MHNFVILICSAFSVGRFLSAEGLHSCKNTERNLEKWAEIASSALYKVNFPYDCTRVPILLCSTKVNKFQGTGSRLFYLSRCLAEGLNTERAIVLSAELESTIEILSPFRAWGNCTLNELNDLENHGKRNLIKHYYPMDSKSLVKSAEMPAVGALYPRQFSSMGYWWWKAQEVSYALRPAAETLQALEIKLERRKKNGLGPTAVFQIRRTDKTQGCAKVYGISYPEIQISSLFYYFIYLRKKSKIKCKSEANAPSLSDFVDELKAIDVVAQIGVKNIEIITDDVRIQEEINTFGDLTYRFIDPEPAPVRVPDKDGYGGIYRGRALKDALDILIMSYGSPLIFTYSSGFGALALQLKQTRENFCSNWVSLDWGKREWPPIGTIGEGGVRGVVKNGKVASKLCNVSSNREAVKTEAAYCSAWLRPKNFHRAPIVSICNCDQERLI